MENKTNFLLIYMTLLFALLFMGSNSDEATEITDVVKGQENWPTKLRFAESGTEDIDELQRAFGPFQDTLEEILEMEIEFYPMPDHTRATEALEFDQVDIVLAGPSEYVQIKEVIPWIETLEVIERDPRKAAIIVHEESGYDLDNDVENTQLSEAFKSHGVEYSLVESGPILPGDYLIVSSNLPEEFVVEMQRRLLENKEEISKSIVASGERDQYK